jgi:hypothetical protein
VGSIPTPGTPPFLKRSDAAEFLKQRHSDSLAGKIPLAKGVTYDALTVRPSEMMTSDRSNAPTRTPPSAGGGHVARTALSALLQARARAVEIPLEQIPALVAELASEQAALAR